jgi:hypothetical protein
MWQARAATSEANRAADEAWQDTYGAVMAEQ